MNQVYTQEPMPIVHSVESDPKRLYAVTVFASISRLHGCVPKS